MGSREGGTTPNRGKNYNTLKKRLKSFLKVNFSRKFNHLSSIGYRFINKQNCVVCHNCYLHDYNFLSNRDPEIFHAKNSPHCLVMRKLRGDEWLYDTLTNSFAEYEYKIFVCKMCQTRKISHYFLPCHHAVCCDICISTMD